ncbi:MAG: PHP domain-containing protein, partial [Lachnospiraceae bacterium]|nr:PHP domain-containing protein [Lachnospiraceae bacterium]
MADMMEGVIVEKLVMTKTHTMLKVCITCNSLIDKQIISRVEKEVTKQLGEHGQSDEYAAAMTQVRFFETYHLSELYTPEKLIEMYKESMLFELMEYSPILAGMLRTAQFDFQENGKVNVSIEQNELYKEKEKEFLRILDKIVCERCGLPCMFTASYHERKPSGRRMEKEAMVRRKAALIASLAGSGNHMEGQDEEFAMQGGDTPWSEETDKSLHNDAGTLSDISLHKNINTSDNTIENSDKSKDSKGSSAKSETKKGEHNTKESRDLHNTVKGSYSGNNKTSGYGKKGFRSARKTPDDPDIFWGYSTDGEIVEISELTDGMNISVCRGQIWGIEKREMRKGDKTIVTFYVTDFTDSIKCKIFCENELLPELMGNLKDNGFYMISGIPAYDTYDKEVSMAVKSMKKYADWREKRMDHSLKKRVELHCHTKYSEMDGVSDAGDLVKRAYEWGHPAIAITDHGGVQALADIFHDAYFGIMGKEKDKAKAAGKPFDAHNAFKVIIGCEIYLVDDTRDVAVDSKGQSLLDDYVVFDIETTGFSYEKNNII